MQRTSYLLVCAALVASSLAPREARANGRFPNANQLVVGPADASLVVARTTFGLLVSRDRGQSFSWICESTLGVRDNQDPAIAIFGLDTLAVAGAQGLALGSGAGCGWASPPAMHGASLVDVAAERSHPSHALVVAASQTATSQTGGASVATLAETFDGGATFHAVGNPLPSDLLVETVDIAPSDGDRFYASGAIVRDGARVGVVEASRDHGATWSRTIVDLAGGSSVFIGAIDPVDPDRVYLRTQTDAADALLVSSDGAATFRSVTTLPGRMLGLAVSPDGRRVAIGGSTPGVLVADRDALVFERQAELAASCLAWSVDGLYACGQSAVDGFVVGRSVDDGATFAPLLARLGDIGGPLASCGGDEPVVQTCKDDWQALAALFGADAGATGGVDAGASPPAVAPSASCAARSTGGPIDAGGVAAIATCLAAIATARRRRRARRVSRSVDRGGGCAS